MVGKKENDTASMLKQILIPVTISIIGLVVASYINSSSNEKELKRLNDNIEKVVDRQLIYQKTQFYNVLQNRGIIQYIETPKKELLQEVKDYERKIIELNYSVNTLNGLSQKLPPNNNQTIN